MKIEVNRQMSHTCQQYKLILGPKSPISLAFAGWYFLSLFSEHPVLLFYIFSIFFHWVVYKLWLKHVSYHNSNPMLVHPAITWFIIADHSASVVIYLWSSTQNFNSSLCWSWLRLGSWSNLFSCSFHTWPFIWPLSRWMNF